MTVATPTPRFFLPSHPGAPIGFSLSSGIRLGQLPLVSRKESRTTRNNMVTLTCEVGRHASARYCFATMEAFNPHFKITLFSEYPFRVDRDGIAHQHQMPVTTLMVGMNTYLLGHLLSYYIDEPSPQLRALDQSIKGGTSDNFPPEAAVHLALSMFYHQTPGLAAHMLYLEDESGLRAGYDVSLLGGNPKLINQSGEKGFNLYTSDPNTRNIPGKAKTLVGFHVGKSERELGATIPPANALSIGMHFHGTIGTVHPLLAAFYTFLHSTHGDLFAPGT